MILAQTGGGHEMMVALNAAGGIVLEKMGTVNEVRLSAAEFQILADQADLLTHNHPSGGGLGRADFGLAVEANLREIHAVGGRYRHRLQRLSSSWSDLGESLNLLDEIEASVRRYLQARVDSGSLSSADASERYWHEVWQRFARAVTQVDYIREER